MGNWWLDEEPWPSPKQEEPRIHWVYTGSRKASAFRVNFINTDLEGWDPAPGLKKLRERLNAAFENLPNAFINLGEAFDLPPQEDFPPTIEQLLARKKRNKQHGPYRGGFDRRGRKF